ISGRSNDCVQGFRGPSTRAGLDVARGGSQLLFQIEQQLLGFPADFFRYLNFDLDEQVTAPLPIQAGNPAPPDLDDGSRLWAGLDVHRTRLARRELDAESRAQGCFDDRNWVTSDEVVAVALESGVRVNAHVHVQIAGGCAVGTRHSLPRHPQSLIR